MCAGLHRWPKGGDDRLVGGAGSDVLIGDDNYDPYDGGFGVDTAFDSGNDVLLGGVGDDEMYGGNSNDIYEVSDADDIIVENAGEGTDVVFSYLSSYTLGVNLENLVSTVRPSWAWATPSATTWPATVSATSCTAEAVPTS